MYLSLRILDGASLIWVEFVGGYSVSLLSTETIFSNSQFHLDVEVLYEVISLFQQLRLATSRNNLFSLRVIFFFSLYWRNFTNTHRKPPSPWRRWWSQPCCLQCKCTFQSRQRSDCPQQVCSCLESCYVSSCWKHCQEHAHLSATLCSDAR